MLLEHAAALPRQDHHFLAKKLQPARVTGQHHVRRKLLDRLRDGTPQRRLWQGAGITSITAAGHENQLGVRLQAEAMCFTVYL